MKRNTAQTVNNAMIADLPSLYDGVFKVADDGRIYRRKNCGYVLAPQTKASKNNRYLVVTAMICGKQKGFYVHRLVAEAYIPNPQNKPTINHLDNNGFNNHVSNLAWATYKENTDHAVENGLNRSIATRGVPCICCGEPTLVKDGVCTACKVESKIIEKRATVIERKAQIVEVILNEVDIDEISERNLDFLRLFSRGATLQEIGDKYGITREGVRLVIDRYLTRSQQGNRIAERVTEQQKQISTYINEMGFIKSRLATRAEISSHALGKMLRLERRMPHDVFERLCEFTKFEPPASSKPSPTPIQASCSSLQR